MKWNFYNYPVRYTKIDYDDVITRITKVSQDLPIVSLYLDGTQKAPGFSDIDLVVFCDRVNRKIKDVFLKDHQDGKTKYLMMHDALILPASLSKRFSKIMGRKVSWKLLLGDKQQFSKIDEVHDFFRLWDDTIMHIFREFLSYYLSCDIDVRNTISKLYSLRYHFSRINDPKMAKKVLEFNTHIDDLRSAWFDDPDELQIVRYLKEAIELLYAHLDLFCDKIKKYLVDAKAPAFFFDDLYFPILFAQSKNYLQAAKEIYTRHKIIIPVFAPKMAALLLSYKQGVIGHHIYTRVPHVRLLKSKYADYARERCRFYNDISSFCRKNKLWYGPLINFNLHELHRSPKAMLKRKSERFMRWVAVRSAYRAIRKLPF